MKKLIIAIVVLGAHMEAPLQGWGQKLGAVPMALYVNDSVCLVGTHDSDGVNVTSRYPVVLLQEVFGGGGGSGTVTSVSSGNLSPLFTSSVANATTTPAITYTVTPQTGNLIYAHGGASPSAPSFMNALLGGPPFGSEGNIHQVPHGNVSGLFSWSAVALASDVSGILPVANGGTNATTTTSVNGTPIPYGTNTNISPSGSAGGDLTGSYPNPTLAIARMNDLPPVSVQTSNYTALANTFVPCDISGGSIVVTLPNAPADGTTVAVKVIKFASSNTVTINTAGSDVYNITGGATAATLYFLGHAFVWRYKASTHIWYVLCDDITYTWLTATFAPISVAGTVTSVTAGTGLSGGTITSTGTISMPNTGTAGTYGSSTQVPVLTTDAQGRVTGVTNTAISAGTVTSVSSGNLSPLFTSSVATSTTTPSISYTTSNAAGNTMYCNCTTSSAAPAFVALQQYTTAASYTTSTTIASSLTTPVVYVITAQAGALLFNNPTGTWVDGQTLLIRIHDNGTARALTFGTAFRSSLTETLPGTTGTTGPLYMEFTYNSQDTKFDLQGYNQY